MADMTKHTYTNNLSTTALMADPYYSAADFLANDAAATARNEARRDAEAPTGRKWWNGAPARVRRSAPAPRPVIFDPWMD